MSHGGSARTERAGTESSRGGTYPTGRLTPHDWLEGRGLHGVLMDYFDEASSRCVRFYA
jgi:hypothetical protein